MKSRNAAYLKRKTARMLAKRALRRAQWIEEHGPCVKCGSRERLEVDHIIPHGLSRKTPCRVMWLWTEKKRLEELSRCQVLCRKCHIKKSTQEAYARMGLELDGNGFRHGLKGYKNRGCRCQICSVAAAKKRKMFRNRAKAKAQAGQLALTLP